MALWRNHGATPLTRRMLKIPVAGRIRTAAALLNWRRVSLKAGHCPLCGRTGFIKLNDNEQAIRCLRCGASVVTQSLVSVLKRTVTDLGRRHVYELSAGGPLVRWLLSHAGRVTLSEYLDDVPPGQHRGGTQCQDVQRLTYAENLFDVCTSTEVFEHVADDLRGFRELCRVLKPGGFLLLTVPLNQAAKTVERARLVDGRVEHLLPPEYHGDRLRGAKQVLCFRNYGLDILDRVGTAGFAERHLIQGDDASGWGFTRPVLVARKTPGRD